MDASAVPDETLVDVLGARARRTPPDRLVLDLVGGVLVGAAALWARPSGWFPLGLLATCFACYGAWALLVRRMPTTAPQPVTQLAARVVGTLGVATFVLLLFALLGVALGPIKS